MAILIPKIIHRIWLGGRPMPEEFVRWGETWRKHHPGWTMKLWTEKNLPKPIHPDLLAQSRYVTTQSNIWRYEILFREGGMYVDTDFECLRSLEPLIEDSSFFAAAVEHHGYEDLLANGFFGCSPRHPIAASLLQYLAFHWNAKERINVGPPYFTRIVRKHSPLARTLEAKLFYPYLWGELERKNEKFPDAYAVHHWASHWYPPSSEPLSGA